jgi:hypothetical protein
MHGIFYENPLLCVPLTVSSKFNVLKDITDRSYENTESAKDGIPQHFF